MRFEAFLDMYGSRWRPLGEADGLPEWIKEIGLPGIQEGVMRVAIARIAAAHLNRQKETGYIVEKPRLGEVMMAYREAEEKATAYEMPDIKCSHCHGSGWCLAVRHSQGWFATPGRMVPRGPGNWTILCIPCHCAAGGHVLAPRERQSDGSWSARPYPQEYRDQLIPYHVGPPSENVRAREVCSRQLESEDEVRATTRMGGAV